MKRSVPGAGTAQPAQTLDFFDTDDAPEAVEEVDEGVLGEAGRNWVRPAPPELNPTKDSLGKYFVVASDDPFSGHFVCSSFGVLLASTSCCVLHWRSFPAAGVRLCIGPPQQKVL